MPEKLSRNYENTSKEAKKSLGKLATEQTVKSEDAESVPVTERFKVASTNYPIFSEQSVSLGPTHHERLGIDETLGNFVRATADTIAVMAGEAAPEFYLHLEDSKDPIHKENRPTAFDEVVFLDKSARPVQWLTSIFWPDFTEQKKPGSSFLAIDRAPWQQRAGLAVDNDGVFEEGSKKGLKATYYDYHKGRDKIPPEYLARIRAVYLRDGLTDDTIDAEYAEIDGSHGKHLSEAQIAEIMSLPTRLDGKNILVVDEVGRSGSSLRIAADLLKSAIPEIKTIAGETFWQDLGVNTGEAGSVPVWYDSSTSVGRGIGEPDPKLAGELFAEYAKDPSLKERLPKLRARMLGAFALGTPVNLSKERYSRYPKTPVNLGPSRELAEEMLRMEADYRAGKILMRMPHKYNRMKWVKHYQELGVEFVPDDRAKNPKSLISLMKVQEDERREI